MNVHIETMQKSDLAQVAALAAQLGYPHSLEEFRERFSWVSASSDYGLFVARASSSGITGWIQINLEPHTLLAGPRADIAALVVDEKFRGQRIGHLLLERAELWARERKLPLIRLRSNQKREDAKRFYLREGFEVLKSSNIFTKQI